MVAVKITRTYGRISVQMHIQVLVIYREIRSTYVLTCVDEYRIRERRRENCQINRRFLSA